MTFQQIMNFMTIVEAGSFNRAEEKTFLTKQALKKQIDVLESELEFKLISRSSKGIELTEAGQLFYDGCRKSLANWSSLVQTCRSISTRKNRLRIGNPAHPRLLLEDVISEFAAQYPDITLDIVIASDRFSLMNRVVSGDLDLAEFIKRPGEIAEGVSYQEIAVLNYICIMSDNHPLACKQIIEPSDLAAYTVGITAKSNIELYHQLEEICPKATLVSLPDSSVQNIANICYNRGIYISKAHFARQMDPFVSVPLDSNITFSCGVVYKTPASETVRKFLHTLNQYMQEQID